jgi:hypothetical protein
VTAKQVVCKQRVHLGIVLHHHVVLESHKWMLSVLFDGITHRFVCVTECLSGILYLHIHLHLHLSNLADALIQSDLFNWYIVITSPPLPNYSPYLPYLTSFAHTVYILFFYCIIDCMFVYSMCNSVLLYVSNCYALAWPGRSCKL